MQLRGVQVEVVPLEAEQLALAQAGAQGEFEQGPVAVLAGLAQMPAGLGGGERLEVRPYGGQTDGGGDVAAEQVFPHPVGQRGGQQSSHVADGRRADRATAWPAPATPADTSSVPA